LRELTVGRSLSGGALREATEGSEALLLSLEAAPELVPPLELLASLARFDGPLLARFSGPLTTPLVEAACLALECSWDDGASLKLHGCFLAPLLRRAEPAALRRLIARGTVPPERLLARASELTARSPRALRLLAPLLFRAPGSARAALALERAAFGLVMSAPDRREGVAAFRSRRPPRFDW